MKVTREPKKPTQFRPITVVIESEGEADLLWAMLNMGSASHKRMLDEFGGKDFKDIQAVSTQDQWYNFNSVYDPRLPLTDRF